jgi:hypothetical protein
MSEVDQDGAGRDLYSMTLKSVEQITLAFHSTIWPVLPQDGFALLLAGDFRVEDFQLVGDVARWCIDHGLFWVSVWGTNCEQVHDIFDKADTDLNLDAGGPRPIVMTTWHDNGSLADTLDFFWDGSFADVGKPSGPSRIVLTIGNDTMDAGVRNWIRHHIAS